MKFFVIAITLIICIKNSFCQNRVKLDAVILVDGKIIEGMISNPKLNIKNNNKSVKVDYYPGNFELDQSDYNMLLSDSNIYISFSFDCLFNDIRSEKTKHICVTFNKSILTQYYFVLNISTASKGFFKRRKKFNKYLLDIQAPNGNIHTIR